MSTFLPAMWAAFFIRVRPASRKANPACMNITSTAATTTQIVFAAISRSLFLSTELHLLLVEPDTGPAVRDVADRRRPHEAVPGLPAAAVALRDPVTPPDDAEAAALVQRERRAVLGKDRRLDRPDAGLLAPGDQRLEQGTADPQPAGAARHVDAVLGDTGVAPSAR